MEHEVGLFMRVAHDLALGHGGGEVGEREAPDVEGALLPAEELAEGQPRIGRNPREHDP